MNTSTIKIAIFLPTGALHLVHIWWWYLNKTVVKIILTVTRSSSIWWIKSHHILWSEAFHSILHLMNRWDLKFSLFKQTHSMDFHLCFWRQFCKGTIYVYFLIVLMAKLCAEKIRREIVLWTLGIDPFLDKVLVTKRLFLLKIVFSVLHYRPP